MLQSLQNSCAARLRRYGSTRSGSATLPGAQQEPGISTVRSSAAATAAATGTTTARIQRHEDQAAPPRIPPLRDSGGPGTAAR
jgi:hypothetical protein